MTTRTDQIRALLNPGAMSRSEIYAALAATTKVTQGKWGATLAQMKCNGLLDSGKRPDNLETSYWLPGLQCAPLPAPAADKGPMPEPAPPKPRFDLDIGPTVEALATMVLSSLRATLATRIQAEIFSQVQAALDAIPELVRQPTRPPRDPNRAHVVVVGLLPGQAEMVSREFHQEYEFTFIEADHAMSGSLKSLCSSAKAIFTMCNFISHRVDDMVKSKNGNLIRVPGGMTSLREALTDFYLESTTTA